MKRYESLLIPVAALIACASLHAAETRVWTSRKGSTLEAELLKADAANATLLMPDKKQMVLKVDDLSLGDRQYLVEYGNVDPKILVAGEIGEPEKQVKIEPESIKKLKDDRLEFGESEATFELTESEHFLIASSGDVRPQAMAETAERIWHGMAFEHMNFRRDWEGKRMLLIIAEKPASYAALGTWYSKWLKEKGQDEAAARNAATWPQVGSTNMVVPEEMAETRKLHPYALVFQVKDNSQFKKPMGPFQIHCIAGALLSKQLGGVSSYGSEGYFAMTTGHAYYKEISLGGKSETQLLDVTGSDNDIFSSKKGFEDGTSWARTLRTLVKKGDVKVRMEPMFKWTMKDLKPEGLVLMYSFSAYMQSNPQRACAYAALVRRIESANQIPPAVEIAKIFGFDSVEAFEADWTKFITEGNFK